MIAKVGRLNWIMVEKRDGTVVFITLYIKELPFCNKCQLLILLNKKVNFCILIIPMCLRNFGYKGRLVSL